MANKSIKKSITGHLPFFGKDRHKSISTEETTKINAPPIKKSKRDQFTSSLTNPPINGMDKSTAVAMVGQYQSGFFCDMELRFGLRYKKPRRCAPGSNRACALLKNFYCFTRIAPKPPPDAKRTSRLSPFTYVFVSIVTAYGLVSQSASSASR